MLVSRLPSRLCYSYRALFDWKCLNPWTLSARSNVRGAKWTSVPVSRLEREWSRSPWQPSRIGGQPGQSANASRRSRTLVPQIEVPASLRFEDCSPSARNAVCVPFGITVRLACQVFLTQSRFRTLQSSPASRSHDPVLINSNLRLPNRCASLMRQSEDAAQGLRRLSDFLNAIEQHRAAAFAPRAPGAVPGGGRCSQRLSNFLNAIFLLD